MKPLIIVLLLSTFCFNLSAQRFHLNTFIGLANYTGDLQDKRFTFSQSKLALGLGLSYELTEQIFLRGGVTIGKVAADDKYNSKNTFRNLNFTSSLTEGSIVLEYYFRNLNEYSFSPYIFAGGAVYHFKPTTKDSNGVKYDLRSLSTEGEGFYNNRKEYAVNQVAIPFGGGLKFVLTDNIRIGVELGMRKLFTDYLDDVSTTYVDQNLLLANRGPKAVELAFRGGELKNGSTYPADGSLRGGSHYKDWYYFTGINLSFRLGSHSGGSGTSRGLFSRKGLGCPTKVY